MENSIFATKPYKRSRNAYCFECMFEYFVSLLTTGAFLATILKHIGASDAVTGVISSMGSLAFLFQVLSVPIIRKVKNTKRFAIVFHNTSQICYLMLYLIPFTNYDAQVRTALFVGGILLAYFGNNFVTTDIYRWGNSYVAPDRHARYSGNKEMISLAGGMIVQIGAGLVMDHFKEIGNVKAGFLFMAAAILLSSVCDFICLMSIQNETKNEEKAGSSFKEVLKHTLGNKTFLFFTLLNCIFYMGLYAVTGFLGTYEIGELGMSLSTVEILTVSACAVEFITTPFIAKYSDRTSYAHGIRLGLLMEAMGMAALMFATPSRWWFVGIYMAFYYMGAAGTGQNFFHILFDVVGEQYFSEACAIKSSISGLVGFGTSLIASRILAKIQANGNTVFGATIYGQQLFAAFAAVLLLLTAVLITVWFHRNNKKNSVK